MRGVREWLLAAVRLLASIVTALIALVLLLALFTGFVLVPVLGLGVPVVAGALGATRTLADLHRREAGRVLHVELVASYSSEPGWGWRDLLACLRDQQNGRDVVWLGAHAVGARSFSGCSTRCWRRSLVSRSVRTARSRC